MESVDGVQEVSNSRTVRRSVGGCINPIRLVVLLAIALFIGNGCSTPAVEPGQIIAGNVVGVHDGDTITLLVGTNQQIRIRLAEIDAPELGQSFGKRSKQALSSKVFGKAIQAKVVDQDRYGRTVGEIFLGNRWINREMVAEGWAWQYRRYSKSQELAKAEEMAKEKKLGVWSDSNPIPPWEFRHPSHVDQPPQEGEPLPLIKLGW